MTNVVSMFSVSAMVTIAAFNEYCDNQPTEAQKVVKEGERKLSYGTLVHQELKKRVGKIVDFKDEEPLARMKNLPESPEKDPIDYVSNHYIQKDPKTGIHYILVQSRQRMKSDDLSDTTLIGFKPVKDEDPYGELEVLSKTPISNPQHLSTYDWFIDGDDLYTVSHNWAGFFFEPVEYKSFVSRFNIVSGEEKHSRNFGQTLDLALRPLPNNKLLVTFGEKVAGRPEKLAERESGHAYFFSREDLLRFKSHQRTDERPLQVIVDEKQGFVSVGFSKPERFDFSGNRLKK